MNKAIAAVLLAGALAGLLSQPDALAQEQTIYKWMDEEGVIHYTARPPEDVDFEEVSTRTREPVEPASGGDETERMDDGAAAGTPPEQPQSARSGPDPEVVAERCTQARSNLENLNRYENITVEGDDGEQRPVSDDERMRMIEEAQQFIDEWC